VHASTLFTLYRMDPTMPERASDARHVTLVTLSLAEFARQE
jgi:hypothetical protein